MGVRGAGTEGIGHIWVEKRSLPLLTSADQWLGGDGSGRAHTPPQEWTVSGLFWVWGPGCHRDEGKVAGWLCGRPNRAQNASEQLEGGGGRGECLSLHIMQAAESEARDWTLALAGLGSAWSGWLAMPSAGFLAVWGGLPSVPRACNMLGFC